MKDAFQKAFVDKPKGQCAGCLGMIAVMALVMMIVAVLR